MDLTEEEMTRLASVNSEKQWTEEVERIKTARSGQGLSSYAAWLLDYALAKKRITPGWNREEITSA